LYTLSINGGFSKIFFIEHNRIVSGVEKVGYKASYNNHKLSKICRKTK